MTEVTAPVTSVGWQITLCDPIDKWRPIVLRWISRRTYAPFLPLQEEINTNCKTTVFITRFTPIDLPLYVIHQYYFDLPRQQWSLLNRFHMEQGHCGACRRKWRLTDTDLCPCGETQTMSHIVESCPLTKLNGGLSLWSQTEFLTVLVWQ